MKVYDLQIHQRKAFWEKMVRNRMCIINLNAEFCFFYAEDDPHTGWSEITGYEVERHMFVVRYLSRSCVHVFGQGRAVALCKDDQLV